MTRSGHDRTVTANRRTIWRVRHPLSVLIGLLALLAAACSTGDDAGAATVETATTPHPDATSSTSSTAATRPATTAPAEPAPEFDFSSVSAIVGDFVADRELNGAGLAIVHRDHGLIHHEHWGDFGPDRVSLVASSSKMLVAGVLLRLQDDGLLDVDRPVAEVVEWGSGNPDITPAQLVSNSSGLVGLGPNVAYGPYICQFLPTGTLQECAEQIFTTDGDDADVITPDTQFRYGGAQWQIAGAIAEAASGRSWADLIEETYVQPCGVESLGFNNHFTQIGDGSFAYPDEFDSDPSQLADTANPNLEAGAYITSGDYAELLLMHLRGGRCGDEQVLSGEALERLHGDRIGEAYDGSGGPGIGYGMGWWVDRATGRLSDGGAYGSMPWLDLEDGYGAFLVIEADSDTGSDLASLLYEPVEAAVAG